MASFLHHEFQGRRECRHCRREVESVYRVVDTVTGYTFGSCRVSVPCKCCPDQPIRASSQECDCSKCNYIYEYEEDTRTPEEKTRDDGLTDGAEFREGCERNARFFKVEFVMDDDDSLRKEAQKRCHLIEPYASIYIDAFLEGAHSAALSD